MNREESSLSVVLGMIKTVVVVWAVVLLSAVIVWHDTYSTVHYDTKSVHLVDVSD